MGSLWRSIRNHPLGPVSLAVLGGVLVGGGADMVGTLRSADLQANSFATEADVPLDTSAVDAYAIEIDPIENIVSIPRKVRPAPSAATETGDSEPVVLAEVYEEPVIEVATPVVTTDAREQLHSLREAYEAQYAELKRQEQALETLENEVISAYAAGSATPSEEIQEALTQLHKTLGADTEEVPEVYYDEEREVITYPGSLTRG